MDVGVEVGLAALNSVLNGSRKWFGSRTPVMLHCRTLVVRALATPEY